MINKPKTFGQPTSTITAWRFVMVMTVVFWGLTQGYGQDPQYSQYYNAAVYHNPAFAGTSTPQRLSVNYRAQWPGLPAPYISYSAAFDFCFQKTGTSFGLIATQDVAGISKFRMTSAGLLIGQKVKLNKDITASFGVQVSYDTRDIGSASLIFPDQVTKDGLIAATAEPKRAGSTSYVNTSIGGLVFGRDWWAGLSIHNFNQPSLDPLGGKAGILYPRTTLIGGLRFPLQDDRYLKPHQQGDAIMPSIMYRSQGSAAQIDLGVTAELNSFVFGLYTRGLPFLNNIRGVFTQDAIIGMVGVRTNDIRLAYSYDYNSASYLSEFQGAHEISLQIGFNLKRYLKYRNGPCPGM